MYVWEAAPCSTLPTADENAVTLTKTAVTSSVTKMAKNGSCNDCMNPDPDVTQVYSNLTLRTHPPTTVNKTDCQHCS